jgi:hypothetical protein
LQPIDEIDELIGSAAIPQQQPQQLTSRKRPLLEQSLAIGLSTMKKKRTRSFDFLLFNLQSFLFFSFSIEKLCLSSTFIDEWK